jgi:hypothetical protein
MKIHSCSYKNLITVCSMSPVLPVHAETCAQHCPGCAALRCSQEHTAATATGQPRLLQCSSTHNHTHTYHTPQGCSNMPTCHSTPCPMCIPRHHMSAAAETPSATSPAPALLDACLQQPSHNAPHTPAWRARCPQVGQTPARAMSAAWQALGPGPPPPLHSPASVTHLHIGS